MKLPKPKTEHSTITKGWGKEEVVYETENCLGKVLTITGEKECSLHFHTNSEKLLYLLSGKVEINLLYDLKEEKIELTENQSIKIPKCVAYNFVGIAPISTILEIGTQETESDIVRIKEGDTQRIEVLPLSDEQFTYWEKHCFRVLGKD